MRIISPQQQFLNILVSGNLKGYWRAQRAFFVCGLYLSNFTILEIKIENMLRHIKTLCSWDEKIVKMTTLPKTSYIFNIISTKILKTFFTELKQIILKYEWKHKRAWIAKTFLGKKNRPERNHAPWFQTILQSYNNQYSIAVAQKQTHRLMEQNTEPRNKLSYLGSLNLWQQRQKYTMEKDSLEECWENWTATCTMRLEHFLTPYTKINAKWITDLNIRLKTPRGKHGQNSVWHKS